jgi:hypothetical protein
MRHYSAPVHLSKFEETILSGSEWHLETGDWMVLQLCEGIAYTLDPRDNRELPLGGVVVCPPNSELTLTASVMGRVNYLGSGEVCLPRGYYLRLADDGTCGLFAAIQARGAAATRPLAAGKAANVAGNQWHNVKLRFSGTTISGYVDDVRVLTVSDPLYASGMAGLVTGGENNARNTAFFDNLIVNAVGAPKPPPTVFPQDIKPLYKP